MAVSKQISESTRKSSNMGWVIVLLLSACQLEIISAYSLRPAPVPVNEIETPGRCSSNPCINGICVDYPEYGSYLCQCTEITCVDPNCNCDDHGGLQTGLTELPPPLHCEGELSYESGYRCDESEQGCRPRATLCDGTFHCYNSVDEGSVCNSLSGGTAQSGGFVRPVNGSTPADPTAEQLVNNKCSENLCGNGKCLEWPSYVHGYLCVCDQGYKGTQCEVQDIDDCLTNPCINGACQDGIFKYTCSCDEGWTGNNCDIDIDDCSNNPCINGACKDGVNQYTCSCEAGWTGMNCDTDIDECSNNPCGSNGACQDGVNQYTCSCDAGWTGMNCDTGMPGEVEDTHPCSVEPRCSSDEICLYNEQMKACLPKIPFAGFCSCKNGGTCDDTEQDRRYCVCPANYSGILCEVGP